MKMVVVALAGALAITAGCGADSSERDPRPGLTATLPTITAAPVIYPGEQWKSDPRGDWSRLDQTLKRDSSSCVVVVKNGVLVHEAYFNGGTPNGQVKVYSITKSLTALLAGMKIDDGDLTLDEPAVRRIPEWRGGDSADVRVRDLLAMTSGRQWSEATDRTLIRSAPDQTAYAIGLPQASKPGERWVYDNAAPQVLEQLLGGDVIAFAQRRLFKPLGMRHTDWPTDRAGNATMYSGVTSTCRDLARVGYLVMRGGQWADDRLVSGDFIAEMTAPSSKLNAAYGLLWWSNAEGRVIEVLRQAGFAQDKAPYRGRLAPNVPADASWAFGYGNQYIAVVPSEGVVAVRLGRRPTSPDRVTFDSFTSAVLAGLETS